MYIYHMGITSVYHVGITIVHHVGINSVYHMGITSGIHEILHYREITSVYHVGITSGIHEILHHREITSVYLVLNTNFYTVVETARVIHKSFTPARWKMSCWQSGEHVVILVCYTCPSVTQSRGDQVELPLGHHE